MWIERLRIAAGIQVLGGLEVCQGLHSNFVIASVRQAEAIN